MNNDWVTGGYLPPAGIIGEHTWDDVPFIQTWFHSLSGPFPYPSLSLGPPVLCHILRSCVRWWLVPLQMHTLV